MPHTHRRPSPFSRRRVLGLGALAAVPAITFGVSQARSRGVPAEATTAAPPTGSDVPVAGASPSGGPKIITSGGGPVPFVRGKAMLGAYLDLTGKSVQQALALRKQQLGRDQRIVNQFYGWTDPIPRSIGYLPSHAVPMISWRGTSYDDILNGSSDKLIEQAARNLRKLGKPTLMRWAWEMNGDWYKWGGAKNGDDPAAFVRCWKHLHGIFADQKADNVSWVWSVNWNDSPNASWNANQHYYPGDKYVDWVGVSGYNLHRELPAKLFTGIYGEYAAKKPLIITEVGAVDRGGSTKADWITMFHQWVDQNPAVGAVTWFDTDTHPGYAERWRIDTDPDSLAAYKAMALDPHFAG
jgi:Glycosyl hydrolase family 26